MLLGVWHLRVFGAANWLILIAVFYVLIVSPLILLRKALAYHHALKTERISVGMFYSHFLYLLVCDVLIDFITQVINYAFCQ